MQPELSELSERVTVCQRQLEEAQQQLSDAEERAGELTDQLEAAKRELAEDLAPSALDKAAEIEAQVARQSLYSEACRTRRDKAANALADAVKAEKAGRLQQTHIQDRQLRSEIRSVMSAIVELEAAAWSRVDTLLALLATQERNAGESAQLVDDLEVNDLAAVRLLDPQTVKDAVAMVIREAHRSTDRKDLSVGSWLIPWQDPSGFTDVSRRRRQQAAERFLERSKHAQEAPADEAATEA